MFFCVRGVIECGQIGRLGRRLHGRGGAATDGVGGGRSERGRGEREPAEDGRRRALEGEARLLRQMLREMRDLRQLAEGYYTRPRDGTYTMSQIYAPRVDSTKQ